MLDLFHIFVAIAVSFCVIPSVDSVTDLFTTWNAGSPPMPHPERAQAVGYDPYIIHLLGANVSPDEVLMHPLILAQASHYVTYNTITKEMSSLQSIPNGGDAINHLAQSFVQIDRIMYIYEESSKCIDTFNMETLTYTSCWTSFPSIPTNSNAACMTIDITARYFYIIPETKEFFFYDSVEDQWYFGPDTIQTAHLFEGCDVLNNKLYYFGGQPCWHDGCAALRTIEYLDISDMNGLKQNPSAFSWNTLVDFLPVSPEAANVRSVRLNNIIYTVTGYRYSGDGTNVDVMGIDLINNQVKTLTEIPTKAKGGSLVWDPCQMRFYYFGGFNGSVDGYQKSWYYSNQVDDVYLPSKYKMDCMVPQFVTTTTLPATTTTGSFTTDLTQNPLSFTTTNEINTYSGHSIPSTTIPTSMTASQHSLSTNTTNEINTYSEHSTNNDAAFNGNNTGALIGLCVGSFIFLLCIILAIYMYINKKTENVQNKVQSVHSKVIQSVNTEFETVINSDQNNNDRNKTNTEICKSAVTVITLPSCQSSLPSGWSAVTDTDGRIYYQNYITKQSQWKKPTAETESGSLYHVTSTVDGIGNSVQVSIPPSAPPSAPELETEEGQGTNIKKMMTGGDNVNNGQLTMSNNNKYKDIKMFFEDVKIVQDFKSTYIQLFIENGFDTLESIKTVSNQDLICIGMDKIGHRKMVLSQAQKL